MKATNMIRGIDDLGRVVIPKEIRAAVGVKPGDLIEFLVEDHKVMMRKYNPGCRLCGSDKGLITIQRVDLCSDCVNKIAGYKK